MLKLCTSLILIFFSFSIQAAQEITLNTTGKPPLNTPQLTGFMDLVAKEAFRRIGYTLKTVQLPAERGLINVNAGLEDGEMSRINGLNKLYPNLIQVPEKIMDWEFVAFSSNKISLTQGWQSLLPYSVAFINGWKILEKNVPIKTDITKVRTPEQLFLMLSKNRADLILYERWGGLLYTRTNKITAIKQLQPPLATKKMFIYLHKKHTTLIPKLASSLKKMKLDGTYKVYYNKVLAPLE